MIDDFTPIIHRLEGRTIRVWPIADVHIGAKECDLDGFESFLTKVKRDNDSYIVLVGDLLNNATKSSVSNVYEETMPPSAQIDCAVELLYPVSDRILGAVGGNHERRSKKDVDLDPMYAIMCMLRIQELYRPNMAFLRIDLSSGNIADSYAIMMTHGKTANKKKQFTSIVEGVDACVFAHTHTPDVVIPSRIRFNHRNTISFHEVVSLTACSWLHTGGYELSGLYLPQAVSRPQCLELEYTGSNNRKGQLRVRW